MSANASAAPVSDRVWISATSAPSAACAFIEGFLGEWLRQPDRALTQGQITRLRDIAAAANRDWIAHEVRR